MKRTRRTDLVLQALRSRPGQKNREISQAMGGVDEGQLSKLLKRLERAGLVENERRSECRGRPNSWSLTNLGEQSFT